MIDQSFFFYAFGIAAAGLVAGGSIGYVLRGARARRQVDTLKDELGQLRDRLASVSRQTGDTEKTVTPQRWTGTEVAAVLGAIGTLLGVVGAIYNNYQGNTLTQLQADLGQAQSQRTESESQRKAFAKNTLALIRYDLDTWSRLTDLNQPTQTRRHPPDLDIDFKRMRGNCNAPRQFKLTFGTLKGPSVLHCNSGSALIFLTKPSTILLIPEEKSQ